MKIRAMGPSEWVLLIILSVFWGGSFFFVELALTGLTPLFLVFARVAIAAAALWCFVLATGGSFPTSPKLWGCFAIMGLFNNVVSFNLIAWGQQHIDSGLASILNATMPMFTVVLAHWLTRDEKLTLSRGAGVLVGLVAVAVMVGGDALKELGTGVVGQLAMLGAAASYAYAAIYGRRLASIPVRQTAAGMLTASAVIMAPVVLLFGDPARLHPDLVSVSALLGLALVSTSAAYIIYFRILERAGATNIALVTLLIPVSALVLGMTLLGERPGWNAYAGMALIFVGLMLIDGRPARWASGVWKNKGGPSSGRPK